LSDLLPLLHHPPPNRANPIHGGETTRHQVPIPQSLPRGTRLRPLRTALHRRIPPPPLDPLRLRCWRRRHPHHRPLPPNASILGLAVDSVNNRLLAAVHSMAPLPIFNALAAYDLRTRQQLFLSLLPDGEATGRPVANAVAVDFKGNAYVTNSLGTEEGNFIWKVDSEGNASIFSRSDKFTESPIDCRTANRGSTAWPTSARGTFSWCRATPGRCSRSMRSPGERGG
ncbi:unnamed protein product, partial [Linum tenue]